jgi:hypothetical protein
VNQFEVKGSQEIVMRRWLFERPLSMRDWKKMLSNN